LHRSQSISILIPILAPTSALALTLTPTPTVRNLASNEANENLCTLLVHSQILMLSLDDVTCVTNAVPDRIVDNIKLYDDNYNIHSAMESRGTEIKSKSIQKSTRKTPILPYDTNNIA